MDSRTDIDETKRNWYTVRVLWGLASLLNIKNRSSNMGSHVEGLYVRLVLDPVRQLHMHPPGLASGESSRILLRSVL